MEIAELSRNILKDWIPIFHEKKLNFEIDIPENRLMVNLDPDGYYRVVNNLVQNVLAHSKARQIKITMSEDSRMVLLRVEDDGVGIARENLPHILSDCISVIKDVQKKEVVLVYLLSVKWWSEWVVRFP